MASHSTRNGFLLDEDFDACCIITFCMFLVLLWVRGTYEARDRRTVDNEAAA
jgi:hypothetical protein